MRRWATRQLAALVSLLVASTPAVWFHSSSACVHAFPAAVVACALLACLRLRPRASFRRRLGAGLAVSLAPLSHAIGLLSIPGLLAVALARIGRHRCVALRTMAPLVLPSLVGSAVFLWISRPGNLPSPSPSTQLAVGLAQRLSDLDAYGAAALAQILRSMPSLAGAAAIGAIAVARRARDRWILVCVLAQLGGSIWYSVDMRAAYFLALVPFSALGVVFGLRFASRFVGRPAATSLLALAIAAQVVAHVPDRLREADAERDRNRTETLFQTGALLLYESRPDAYLHLREAARERTVVNLVLADAVGAPGQDWARGELERVQTDLRERDVVLDRRVYEAVKRGSQLAAWFQAFRSAYRVESLPGVEGFERLRWTGRELAGTSRPSSRPG